MSLSTYYLEDGRHLARLHRRHRRRRRRRRAYAPTSNTASHDNHEKINSWVSFSFLYGYGAPLGVRAAGTLLTSYLVNSPPLVLKGARWVCGGNNHDNAF